MGGVDVVALEALVILAEWLGYALLLGVSSGVALRLSLFANIASALVGLAVWTLMANQ